MEPDGGGLEVCVVVVHGKTEHVFTHAEAAAGTTVGELMGLLAERTGVRVAHQKLIHKGRTLLDPDATVLSLLLAASAGGHHLKLTLIGATAGEIEQLEAAAQAAAKGRGRVIDDLRLLSSSADGAARRRPAGGLRRRQYGFKSIETLPGLPEQERAQAILEELAEDPGVLHVMQVFKWSVDALCELYPEGYVGVSDVCVMGLNQNKGQKIMLRLRTDDLKGWRKILSIKKVLYHELAHNEHGDHDSAFYMLMRRIEKEVQAFNATGRRLGGAAGGGLLMPPPEAAGGFVGGSGRLGGESGALTSVLTAREMAGLAAAQRKTEEEQAIEDACPSGRGALAVHARPHDAASPVVELGKQETEVVEAPATAVAVASAEEQQGGSGLDVDVANDDDLSPPPHSCCRDAGHGHAHAAAPASPPPPPPPPAAPAEDEAPIEQLLALGFAWEAVVGALRWAGGDVQRAANHLVASGGVLGTEPAPAALPVDADVPVDPSTREGRVLLAARKLFREETRGDPAGRAAALSTLLTMIQAVLDHPDEAKYKRVRLVNAKFQQAVGRHASGLELLRAIGFEERTTPEGEAVLLLTRNDAGLLWLGKAALEAEAETETGAGAGKQERA